jgi:hypothetical protein
VTEFTGGETPGFNANQIRQAITTGPDGLPWFTESGSPGGIGRINGPEATTDPASAVGVSTAGLSGSVNPNGATISGCRFEYGTSSSYGASVPCTQQVGGGTSPIAVFADVSGLKPASNYHFRLVASNATGQATGTDSSLTTFPSNSDTTAPALSGLAPRPQAAHQNRQALLAHPRARQIHPPRPGRQQQVALHRAHLRPHAATRRLAASLAAT